MIKFFRKIRQRLLAENKFSKYFLYAIGEIVLVVIGILIALSINNWNEYSNQRIEEQRILVDLKNEVSLAIDAKIELRERYKSKLDTLAFALDKLFSKEVVALSDSECFNIAMTHIFDWKPSSVSTIEELVASGKINLIRSEELRRKIILFRSISSNIELQMNRVISEVHVLVDLYPELLIRNWDGHFGVYNCDFSAMKKNRYFLAHLQSNRGRTGGLVSAADAVIASLEEIIALIEV